MLSKPLYGLFYIISQTIYFRIRLSNFHSRIKRCCCITISGNIHVFIKNWANLSIEPHVYHITIFINKITLNIHYTFVTIPVNDNILVDICVIVNNIVINFIYTEISVIHWHNYNISFFHIV